ncbi:hypothetical protein GCM10027300_36110 [Modestobacter lapidis]
MQRHSRDPGPAPGHGAADRAQNVTVPIATLRPTGRCALRVRRPEATRPEGTQQLSSVGDGPWRRLEFAGRRSNYALTTMPSSAGSAMCSERGSTRTV